jgi:hypothetical protein
MRPERQQRTGGVMKNFLGDGIARLSSDDDDQVDVVPAGVVDDGIFGRARHGGDGDRYGTIGYLRLQRLQF